MEPSKTKFPQLYYEAKLYKIFNGAGKFGVIGILNFCFVQLACQRSISLARRATTT